MDIQDDRSLQLLLAVVAVAVAAMFLFPSTEAPSEAGSSGALSRERV